MCDSCDAWADEIQSQEQPSDDDSTDSGELKGEAISRPDRPIRVSAVPLK